MNFLQWIQKQSVAYTVYSLALAAMFVLLAVIVAKLFFVGSKNDKLTYLKNYKKGQFVIIYLIAIPLYFFGFIRIQGIESGTNVLQLFLKSVKSAFDLVKFDFGMDNIAGAMTGKNGDTFYYATVLICYIITVINVLMFSASLLWQRFKNFCKKAAARRSKNLYIVVGGNNNNILLLDSLKRSADRKARGLMLVKADAAMRDNLYLNGICYDSFDCVNGGEDAFRKKIRTFLGFGHKYKRYMKKNVTVMINTEDDERNLLYVKAVEELLEMYVKNGKISANVKAEYEEKRNKIEKSSDDEAKKEEELKKCKLREKTDLKNGVKFIDVPVNAKEALVMVYAFCKVENQSAFKERADGSKGHVNLLSRYEQIAFDFVDKYPLTHFMTDEHVDYKKGLINNDIEMNVCLVGFGPTNRQIFLKTVSDAQFFTEVNGQIVHKKVHYYVYDSAKAYEDKNLNQAYFRYSLEFFKEYKQYKAKMDKEGVTDKSEKWNYLPLPDYPADDWFNPELNDKLSEKDPHFKKHFCKTDINSCEFYKELKKVICKKNAYSYIIIAFGEDLENIDLAKKISARLDMWNKSKDTHIFAKVRSGLLVNANDAAGHDGIIEFGSTESVYDLNKIADNHIRKLAYLKSFTFTRDNDGNRVRDQEAVKNWMRSSSEQKAGNYYSCLNLKTKLNLLGYTYVSADDKAEDATECFYKQYFGTQDSAKIANLRYQFESEDEKKKIYTYDKSIFYGGSVRTLLAMQEHQRWNANYICNGVIPSKKNEIDGNGGGKDMKKKLVHYNITTFDGLEEYRIKAVGSADESHKYEKEVRPYDYRIIDYADKILKEAGYKIVRKQTIIDIYSKGQYPADVLSNFYANDFVFDGVECASMEGFLQSLKYRNKDRQVQICELSGKEAKRAGKRKFLWKMTGNLYWKGKHYKRNSKEFDELRLSAYKALLKNESFQDALQFSKGCELRHSIGKHHKRETILTEEEFIGYLEILREKQKQNQ